MANLKFKYTLEKANKVIKSLVDHFPIDDRREYARQTGIGYSTLGLYLRGACGSIIVANHLAEYMEQYVTDKKQTAA